MNPKSAPSEWLVLSKATTPKAVCSCQRFSQANESVTPRKVFVLL